MEIQEKWNITFRQQKKTSIFFSDHKAKPEEKDKEALRKYFDNYPEMWQCITNLAAKVEDSIIKENMSNSFLAQEAHRRKLDAMRQDLGWSQSTELERILIEQVCLNWLRLTLLESLHHNKLQESHSFNTGMYWDKRLSEAQKRYLKACESLAKVRKYLAEANFRDEQARKKRTQGAAIAGKLLKDLTTRSDEEDD